MIFFQQPPWSVSLIITGIIILAAPSTELAASQRNVDAAAAASDPNDAVSAPAVPGHRRRSAPAPAPARCIPAQLLSRGETSAFRLTLASPPCNRVHSPPDTMNFSSQVAVMVQAQQTLVSCPPPARLPSTGTARPVAPPRRFGPAAQPENAVLDAVTDSPVSSKLYRPSSDCVQLEGILQYLFSWGDLGPSQTQVDSALRATSASRSTLT